MKGTIVCCLAELVQTKFGENMWKQLLTSNGLDAGKVFTTNENVDDGVVIQIITSLCKQANITPEQAAEVFGDFWVNVYAPKMYPIFLKRNKNALSFLLDMDNVHFYMTKTMKGAEPPHFKYERLSDDRLRMQYESKRGLFHIFIGLIKGVAHYYKEKIEIEQQGDNQVVLRFVKE